MQIDIQIPFSEIKIIYKREGFELVAGFFFGLWNTPIMGDQKSCCTDTI